MKTKPRYESLDGLRGVAAMAVFLFHFTELIFPFERNPLRHTYLAVDFFFALSGFVMGYAYDNRMSSGRMNLKNFFIRRLVRLHPLVIVGVLLGLAGYLFDPFVGDSHAVGTAIPYHLLFINLILGLLLVPSPALPDCFGATHSLDAPSWSLAQEYLANIIYGLFGHRLGKRGLFCIMLASIGALVWTSLQYKGLNAGWGWGQLGKVWVAPIRTSVSFSTGLVIFRYGWKIKLPQTFIISAIILIAAFMMPIVSHIDIYDLVCVLVVFPLIIMAGAAESSSDGIVRRICNLSGRLSYPVYILHYPFVWLFFHWLYNGEHSGLTLWTVVAVTYLSGIVFAWGVLVFFDEPVRKWLTSLTNKQPVSKESLLCSSEHGTFEFPLRNSSTG